MEDAAAHPGAPQPPRQTSPALHPPYAPAQPGQDLDLQSLGPLLRAQAQQAGTTSAPCAILVDATASEEAPDAYLAWLRAGVHVVTPNKKFGAGALERHAAVQQLVQATGMSYLQEVCWGEERGAKGGRAGRVFKLWACRRATRQLQPTASLVPGPLCGRESTAYAATAQDVGVGVAHVRACAGERGRWAARAEHAEVAD